MSDLITTIALLCSIHANGRVATAEELQIACQVRLAKCVKGKKQDIERGKNLDVMLECIIAGERRAE